MMLSQLATGLVLSLATVPSDTPALSADTMPVESNAARGSLSEMELAIWNDPAFKKRFAESYVAETEIEPTVTLVEREHMQKVLEFMAEDRIDKAISLLNKHGGEAASAVFDFTLANIRFQQEELEQAATHYRKAVAKHPKFRRAWGNMGLIYVRSGEFAKAAEALSQVISLGGGDAVNYGLLGFAYSNLDNHLAAESAYRMAVLLDPLTLDWKRGLAISFFKQRRFADAVALCGTLIKERPDAPEFWLLQANAYIGLNQPAKAAENYEIVDRLGGATPDSLNNLGDIYVNEGLFDLAVNSYARALTASADTQPTRALRAARVLASHGALDETSRLVGAIETHRGEVLEDGQKKDLLKLRARIAVASGAGEEEARVLEEIVALDPLDGEALILLGKHSLRSGDNEKAAFYYERATSLEAFEADAKVAHAQLLVSQSKYSEALPLLRSAQLLKPRDNVQQYLDQVEKIAQKR